MELVPISLFAGARLFHALTRQAGIAVWAGLDEADTCPMFAALHTLPGPDEHEELQMLQHFQTVLRLYESDQLKRNILSLTKYDASYTYPIRQTHTHDPDSVCRMLKATGMSTNDEL